MLEKPEYQVYNCTLDFSIQIRFAVNVLIFFHCLIVFEKHFWQLACVKFFLWSNESGECFYSDMKEKQLKLDISAVLTLSAW